MTFLLRCLSFLIGAGGFIGGISLFVLAQPPESYGEVNGVLVGYGIGVLFSSLFWAVLGMAVAKGVDAVEDSESNQAKTKARSNAENQTTSDPATRTPAQDVEDTGPVLWTIIAIVVFALLFIAGGILYG